MSCQLCYLSVAICNAARYLYDPREKQPLVKWGLVMGAGAVAALLCVGTLLLSVKLDQVLFKDGYFSPTARALLMKVLKVSALVFVVSLIMGIIGYKLPSPHDPDSIPCEPQPLSSG